MNAGAHEDLLLAALEASLHAHLADRPAVHRLNLGVRFAVASEVASEYERFLCGLTALIGRTRPKDDVDRALRNLLADTFDMLYVARSLIFDGYSSAPFPLLRRAFESISVFQYVLLDQDNAKRWAAGARIGNAVVRRFLSKHGHLRFAESLRRTYAIQSNSVHPNQDRMVCRELGERTTFTLAGAGSPPLLLVAHYLQELLDMWAWFSNLAVKYFSPTIGPGSQTIVTREEGLAAKALAEFDELGVRIRTLCAQEGRSVGRNDTGTIA